MGTRLYEIPGGEPTHTGAENWGGGAASGGGSAGLILDTDKTYYIDAESGESSNDGSSGAPWDWFGPLADALKPFVRIDATVLVNVLGTEPAEFEALDLPPFGPRGKLVILGELTTSVANFVADPGSTELVLRVGGPVEDWAGMTIMCTIGNNAGYKRSVARVTFGDTNQIWPSERWPFDPTGDTFYVSRPGSNIDWPSMMDAPRLLRGGGGTVMPYAPANRQSGVWFSNISITGAVAIGRGAVVNFVGVEVLDLPGEAPRCVTAYDDAIVRAGICPTAAPWIGQSSTDPLWSGWGIQQPGGQSLPVAGIDAGHVEASIAGTFCGVRVELGAGIAELVGGCLRGSSSLAALRVSAASVTCTHVMMFSTAPHVLEAFDDAHVSLGGTSEYEISSLPPTDPTSFEMSTLLRAAGGGVIEVLEACGVIGTTFGLGQDASGGGLIRWNGPVSIHGETADLASEGFRAGSIVLEHAPSVFDGGVGVSRIERYGEASQRFASALPEPRAISDVAIRLANGPAVTVFPAPPTGYVRVVVSCRFGNNDLAATIPVGGTRLLDDDGVQFTNSATLAPEVGIATVPATAVVITNKELRAQLVGAGAAGASLFATSFVVPAPPIYIAQALTGSYAPVTAAIPTQPGVRAVPWHWAEGWAPIIGWTVGYVVGGDSSALAFRTRMTRGTAIQTQDWGSFPAGSGRTGAIPWIGLKQGDVFEIRQNVAPTTPNSNIYRLLLDLVPELVE